MNVKNTIFVINYSLSRIHPVIVISIVHIRGIGAILIESLGWKTDDELLYNMLL